MDEKLGKAVLLKDGLSGFRGYASLYKLDPPLAEYLSHDEDDQTSEPVKHEYVVVSSVTDPFFGSRKPTSFPHSPTER